MAPFLSFTAEEAWTVFGDSESIFLETYADLRSPNELLIARWSQDIRRLKSKVLLQIERKREAGAIGSSLQAEVTITCNESRASWLREFEGASNELKFLFVVSKLSINVDESLNARSPNEDLDDVYVDVIASAHPKCERCWHYREDVGIEPAHTTICGRCTSNLYGAGEPRLFA